MGKFNISPEFKEKRKEKQAQKKQKQKTQIIMLGVLSALLIAIIVGIAVGVANSAKPLPIETTPMITPETSEEPTEAPVVTPTPEETSGVDWSKIQSSTVIYLDVGHGMGNSTGIIDVGAGAGSIYNELSGKYEDELNLEIALKLREYLKKKGYTVIISREGRSTESVDPDDRVRLINSSGAELMISIHANSSVPDAKGTRIVYWATRKDASECLKYANEVKKSIDSFGEELSQKPVLVSSQSVAVIRDTKIPAILVETCFLTNEIDAGYAMDENWQKEMAKAIASGIESYFPAKIVYK